MYLIEDIIKRLKNELKLTTDKEIYEKMEVSQGVFSNWKARNTIPFLEITTLCFNHNLNVKYILSGEKEEEKEENTNFKEKIVENLGKLNEKELKYFYHLMEAEITKREF